MRTRDLNRLIFRVLAELSKRGVKVLFFCSRCGCAEAGRHGPPCVEVRSER